MWTSLLSIAVVPFYLRLLGAEAYGLVGFFTALQATLNMLDLGLSTATCREVAARMALPASEREIGPLVRTIESIYWGVGLLLGVVIAVSSSFWATHWFNCKELSHETAALATAVFGMTLVLRWPVALYRGVLRGLERHLSYNLVLVIAATVRAIGAIFVLFFVSRTVVAFLVWQLITTFIEISLMTLFAWRGLMAAGVAEERRFDFSELRKIWRFVAGVSAVTVLGIALIQSDRLVISKLLPLEQLGYYTVAVTLASAMGRITGPIITAVFPRLTSMYSAQDKGELASIYFRATTAIVYAVVPVATVLAFFAGDFLLLWTKSQAVVDHAAQPLSLLVLGYMFNTMAHLASTIQFAAGRIRFLLLFNLSALLIYASSLCLVVPNWGIAGAAALWLVLNIIIYLVLPTVAWRGYFKDFRFNSIYAPSLKIIVLGGLLIGGARGVAASSNAGPVLSVVYAGIAVTLYFMLGYLRYKTEFNRLFCSFLNRPS
ncbi:MAG: oligosaccharide flippase family protein [Geobacter sp.]|nr:oligosaccharide flippase family protein [Geobacter sp.]